MTTPRLCDVKVTARKVGMTFLNSHIGRLEHIPIVQDVDTAMNEIVPLLLRFCEPPSHFPAITK